MDESDFGAIAIIDPPDWITGYAADMWKRAAPRQLSARALPQANAYVMVRRCAIAASIGTAIGNRPLRATGATAYLKNGGTLENVPAMANHASTRTTQLYDRRRDEISLDEVERIRV